MDRLASLYAARSGISRTIARTPGRDQLFDEICRTLVEVAGFRMAWIGWYDREADHLVPAAFCGHGSDAPRPLPVRDPNAGPTVQAFRARQPFISNDLLADLLSPARDESAARGLRSGAIFPFGPVSAPLGTLSVYSGIADYFGEREVSLLAETRDDITFALDNLAREAERLEADAAARDLTEQLGRERARLHEAQEVANIGSWETDPAVGLITWSEQTHRIFETDPRTFEPSYERFLELVHPDDRVKIDTPFAKSVAAVASGADARGVVEHRIITPRGTVKVVEERWRVFAGNGDRPVRAVGTCLDITERHEADVRIRRLNRTYAMLSAVNKTIVHEQAPEDVLQAVCEIAVSVGGFRMALVGMAASDHRHVTPIAYAGVVDGYLDALSIDRGDASRNTGPTARALESGQHVICNDIANDAGMAPWRDRALQQGYRASGAFPILKNGEVVGTYNLYSAEVGFFDEQEVRLLDELAMDIGFALAIHDRETERRRIEGLLRQSEANLRESISELRAVTLRLYEIKEEERARIARDLHDHLGQALTALKMDVAEVGRRLDKGDLEPVRERLTEMSSLIDDAVEDMRRVAAALRPATVDELGLLEAVRLHLHDIERRGGPVCTLTTALTEVPIRKDNALVAFRILQEAMTNVLRHAGATHVDVLVDIDDAAMLRLVVRDNGRGLPPAAERIEGTLGLVGMRDRARLVDGEVMISGSPGLGTAVTARIPLGGTR
jgi:signal transduction histidine kinase/PAS domain-containing protein